MAASGVHANALWVLNDGGKDPVLYAVSRRGRRLARFLLEGVNNTDWESLAAFELDGKHYLLIADTGDNGGLRRTLQLHVVEEPTALTNATLRPAWSIAFRWPDGARDCEAVVVDADAGQILLLPKKRPPAELFALPLRPGPERQIARQLGTLTGITQLKEDEQRSNPRRARRRGLVTGAELSPDARTLAVLTYERLMLYRRAPGEPWASAVARTPEVHSLPLLPQAEALAWSHDGRGLFVTSEFQPAPLYWLVP